MLAIENAKYAFCAAMDEIILASSFSIRPLWERNPLQLRLFGEHLAGENFFDKLETMRIDPVANVEVLEVFYTVLLLGFQGKYLIEGTEKLDYLISRLGQEIKDALQEMLTLYNLTQSHRVTREIQGIKAISTRPATTLVASKHFSGLVRGLDISLTLDESAFVGSGAVLFGAVLERFFALYSGPNSFTRLTLHAHQLQQEIAKWPARAGKALVI